MAEINLKGLGVALVTPFKKDKSVDFEALQRMVEYVLEGQADYIVVLGTTGETPALFPEEKDKIKKTIIQTNAGKVPLILGVGGNNTQAVVNELKEGDFSGFDAILSVVPFYNKPSQEGLYQHFRTVSEHSPLPIILYNIPGRSGVNMTAETTLHIARDFDNVIGIKEASGDIEQMQHIIDGRPDGFLVLSGDDGIAIDLMRCGGDGVISVAVNAFPHCFMRALNHAKSGDFDRAEQEFVPLAEAVKALFAEGNPVGVKCALSIMGIISDRMRLPLVAGSDALREKFRKLIAEYDLC